MLRKTLPQFVLTLMLSGIASPVRADVLHAFAEAGTLTGPSMNSTGIPRGELGAAVSASRSEGIDTTPGYLVERSASARSGAAANVGLLPQALLGVSASVSMANVSWIYGGQYRDALAAASWDDTFSLSHVYAPIDVAFTFKSHGIMDYIDAYSMTHSLSARLQPLAGSDGSGHFHTADRSATTKYGYSAGTYDLVNNGWDSFTIQPISNTRSVEFTGTITLVLSIYPDPAGDPIRGSFLLGTDISLEFLLNDAPHGDGSFFNGMGTSGLTSVMVLDPDHGPVTPESLGMVLSFDSGMASPNGAVPEPSSVVLLGFASLASAVYGLRQRHMT